MRLIDADALIKAINKCRCADCTEDRDIGCETCQWDSAICMVQDAPTVEQTDAAECYNCGARLREGDIYCWRCGRRMPDGHEVG